MNIFEDIKTGLEQAIEYEVNNMEIKKDSNYMTSDEIASLLVKLYAEFKHYYECDNDDYAMAVGIAIRMLSD